MSPDEELARFVAGLGVEEVPAQVAAAGRAVLLDAIASAIAGRGTEETPVVERLAGALFGGGSTVVIGGRSLSPAGAAFLNGFQVTAATVCDVHRPTLTHVTPEVVPAVLAVAHDTGGADVLTAIVAGCEVTVRVAEALDGETHRTRGWHNPGIAGAVGAAAAVARARRLDVSGVRHAFGHAVSQAAGTFAALGTPGVKVHQARGALSGLLAGTLAADGIPAALDALTTPRGGLLPAYVGGGTPGRLTEGLGTRWSMLDIALRRWPAASSLQSVIAATLEARTALVLGAMPALDVIERVRVDLPPRAYSLNASHGWGTQLEALQSARWIVAVCLADGECWVEQTAPARLDDPLVGGFATHRVAVHQDDDLPLAAARVTLALRDGSAVERRIDLPSGDPVRPLTADDLIAKLRRATAGTSLDADRILAAIHALPGTPSGSDLVTALTSPIPRP
ncbi:MAG: MmgE/PrpD family protein [Chloroflexi bacterium]|nr:MmgE/PrpD family protein [Chloroflexota bacterium]